MSSFARQTGRWFTATFGEPTEAQREAWPAIHSGANALVIAPTGSGKTLSAFLYAIDRMIRERTADDVPARNESMPGDRRPGVRVLYISPLKALGADVARNLTGPLEGIADEIEHDTGHRPNISVAMRSGDSTPQERRRIASHPPDILVTTPESLYLMLTSKARRILNTVDTVIVDEVHAIAGTKRGAHLAVSLERLDRLTGRPAQRIGLSATVQPADEAARFLGGARPVTIIAPSQTPQYEIKVIEPVGDMHDLASSATDEDDERKTGSIWPMVERSVLDAVLDHHTTLVFVNSRGLCEKLTARLNDLYAQRRHGPQPMAYGSSQHYAAVVGSSTMLVNDHDPDDTIAMAHHGSVSKDRRKQVESDLKAGRLRCVVATSSLELGIDMGSVDLVIQISPPFSVASGLQRIGRADHRVGGVSHARFHPLTRRQILDTTAAVESMRSGDIETFAVPANPLDVLAQQTVAAAAMDPLNADDWYHTVRRSAPFANLPRTMFDAVLAMMSGAYSSEAFAAFRPILLWDRNTGAITARPGAQRLAVTSGGTIPDRGTYSVVLPDELAKNGPKRVGELDEEMVYESRVGDVITLGTSTWQIRQITRDRVIVLPAPGRTARLPFWHGDGDGRDAEFGRRLGAVTRELSDGLDGTRFDKPTRERLYADGLDHNATDNLARLLHEQQSATDAIPDDRTLVIERCQDEDGDWRILLHSPYGRRVHEPWAMGINARLRDRYGYEGQTMADDDGIVLRLPDTGQTMPGTDLFVFDPDELENTVRKEISGTALFAARFRECAARSLFMPRMNPGRRVPLWQQRLRAAQLQSAASGLKNFPLMLEAARECLQDVYDMPALRSLMDALNERRIDITDVTTATPSPFAQSLLFGYTGANMYQYDVPQAERSAAMLSMDVGVLAELLGSGEEDLTQVLDAGVIADIEQRLQCLADGRRKHGMEGVADLLRTLGPLTAEEIAQRIDTEAGGNTAGMDQVAQANDMLETLRAARRAEPMPIGPHRYWATPDDRRRLDEDPDDLILRYARTHGPFTARDIAERFGLHLGQTRAELRYLAEEGRLLAGMFLTEDGTDASDAGEHQYLHPDVFRTLRSRSLAKARAAVRPVAAEAYQSMVLARQGVGCVGGEHYEGPDGVLRVIEQLEGTALPAAMWETAVFPARVRDYRPPMLDELLASAEAAWVGSPTGNDTRTAGSIAWYIAASAIMPTPSDRTEADSILERLHDGGAFHARQLAGGEEPPSFENHMRRLIWNGLITGSTFAPIRAQIGQSPTATRHASAMRRSPNRRRRTAGGMGLRRMPDAPAYTEFGGLWSSVAAIAAGDGTENEKNRESDETRRAVAIVDMLLDRYGVIAPPLAQMAGVDGGFAALYPVLKAMEERGDLVRGMFVEGLGASQFARRRTVDALRRRAKEKPQSVAAVDTLDPANLYGAALPWPLVRHDCGDVESRPASKPTRREGTMTVIVDGSAALYAAPRSHHLTALAPIDDEHERMLRRALAELAHALRRRYSSTLFFADINGTPLTARTPMRTWMHAAGFTPAPQGMKLYP
ncbi:ATP-dependent helicase [Bifidobacterium sp. SMB2]|uniref:ATP-dependent helicase n=2 Tax=Bifidobacterium saimiriisciurei TaxID=2661627 RepID=A0ABX0CHC9_9BIFI|nr:MULTISPECIES: ATP-dependent helicase [Bifidobacterium]NEG95838.1 ATP-dependent helicase [Bifidobacterium sp. SMB2]NEH12093.1 ATP-dependent helicase [Bifidobacterium saimiriisciurei]